MTAHMLLSNFVDLKPGDWVVQNVANGSVSTIGSIRPMYTSELRFGRGYRLAKR